MWWNLTMMTSLHIDAEPDSERLLKIGQHLANIRQEQHGAFLVDSQRPVACFYGTLYMSHCGVRRAGFWPEPWQKKSSYFTVGHSQAYK